jgi:branched-chain amino acid transport system permease protein
MAARDVNPLAVVQARFRRRPGAPDIRPAGGSESASRPQWVRILAVGRLPIVNGILALAIVLLLASKFGMTSYNTFVMETVALYGIAVYGLDIAAGFAGVLSLGHGAAFAVGGYTVGVLAAKHGMPIWVCLPAGLAVGAVLGILMGLPAIKIGGLGLGFISLGFALITGDIASNAASLTGGNDGISGVVAHMGFGAGSPPMSATALVVTVFAVLYVVYVFHARYRRSRVGRSAVTVRDNPIGARALGINVGAAQVLAVTTASAVGAVAGGLYTYTNQFVSPDITNLSISILFVVMVVFGGMGNTYGPLVGAAVIGPLPIELASHPGLNQYIYAGLLLGVVLLRPRGVVGLTAVRAKLPRLSGNAITAAGRASAVPAPSSRVVLHCESVSRTFGGVLALRGVDLTVSAGEVVAIVGPNGSGKTTLLNVASGFYAPTGGKVWLEGKDVSGFNATRLARLGVGRTFQAPKVFPDMAVGEHLALGLEHRPPQDRLADEDLQRSALVSESLLEISYDLLSGSGMDRDSLKESRALSHGQRRFLEIAMAIVRRPPILLLDEPASGLSSEEKVFLVRAMRRLADIGIAVVLVEHHLDLVGEIADRILVLHLGEVLWTGVPSDLSSSLEVRDAYLGRLTR